MKNLFLNTLATLSLLSPTLQAKELSNIQVIGVSNLQVKADYLEWQISIRAIDDTLQQSQAINEKALGNLLKVLEVFAVSKEDRTILQISHGKNMEYDNKLSKRVQRGFYSNRDVVFNLRDTAKHADILTNLVEFKNLEVEHVSFKSSKEATHKQQARVNALKNAQTKAVQMAGVLNMEIGNPTEIIELNPNSRSSALSSESDGMLPTIGGSSSKSYSLDKVSVKQAVKVTFSISPK